jgi:hypothetical protein
MLGFAKKLVKYVVHLSERKILLNLIFVSKGAQTRNYQFLMAKNSRD